MGEDKRKYRKTDMCDEDGKQEKAEKNKRKSESSFKVKINERRMARKNEREYQDKRRHKMVEKDDGKYHKAEDIRWKGRDREKYEEWRKGDRDRSFRSPLGYKLGKEWHEDMEKRKLMEQRQRDQDLRNRMGEKARMSKN